MTIVITNPTGAFAELAGALARAVYTNEERIAHLVLKHGDRGIEERYAIALLGPLSAQSKESN